MSDTQPLTPDTQPATESRAPTLIGQVLAHYEILALIGEGGMGRVYRALDRRLNRPVALKLLPEQMADDPVRRARLEREARAIALLNHPHIVTVHSIEVDADIPFLTMEFLPGPSLADIMPRSGFAQDTLLEIAVPIVEAVATAHNAGIVHRDLKPANIVMDAGGQPKLLDFGLARGFGDPRQRAAMSNVVDSSVNSAILGTIAYMSPEQSEGGRVGGTSDVFSLGIIMYEMATGVRPFTGATSLAVLASILSDTPPPIHESRSHISPELSAVIGRCLEKDPRRRYRDAGELLVELKEINEQARVAPNASPFTDVGSPALIVVLPFGRNAGPIEERLGECLAAGINAALSQSELIHVVPQATAVKLGATAMDARTLARRAGVQFALDGALSKTGDDIRVTAELLEVSDDSPLWSQTYTGTIAHIPEIQEALTGAVVNVITDHVLDRRRAAAAERGGFDPRCFDHYLRVRRDAARYQPGTLERGIVSLEKALEIAPGSTPLLRELGLARYQYLNARQDVSEDHLREAEQLATVIEAADPQSPQADMLRGIVAEREADITAWVRHLTRAHRMEPDNPDVIHFLAMGLALAGRCDAARDLAQQLSIIDPRAMAPRWLFAFLDFLDGRFDDAVVGARTMIALQARSSFTRFSLAHFLAVAGHKEEAITTIERMPGGTDDAFVQMGVILKFSLLGEREVALRFANGKAVASMPRGAQRAHFMAACCALIEERDLALEWLTASVRSGFIHYQFLAERDPMLQSLRSDPGFARLMDEARTRRERFDTDLP
jgi:serine/threonine protein kinase